jgi:O-antigen ligase
VGKRLQAKRPLLRLNVPQVLGLALIFCLSLSIGKSAAPALSAFKVYQMLVCLMFTQLFVKRFGVHTSLSAMLLGNVLLCVSIAICAFLAPNLVWTASEFNPDPSRLYGELIAPTGVVSVLAIILLLTVIRRPLKPLPISLFALLCALLVFSLMRTAYVAALVFFALVFLKRPNIKPLQRFTYLLGALAAILYAYDLLPSVSHYRSPETIATLSDRIGLWRYLAAVTLNQSPWLGLGYYSASRIHGPEYNPGLGTAHSIFLEVLSGGGVLSLVMLVALTAALSASAARLLILNKDRHSFAASSLFVACLLFGCMGDEIDSGPVAICFWCAAAILPKLRSSLSMRAKRNTESGDCVAPMATTGAVGT